MLRIFLLAVLLAAFAGNDRPAQAGERLLLAAAASLRYVFDNDLIPMFTRRNPGVEIEATYDSSGKLQTQIENGLEADVFMSAAPRQMNALVAKKFVDAGAVVNLLENRIVLIRPANAPAAVAGFADADAAETIAVGDPDSVPAGQYAREAFTSLGIWEKVLAKASLGTNVTEVLGWVAEGSADIGVVYATDAATTDKVAVIASAPAGSLRVPVLYPAAPLAASRHAALAARFVAFLQTPEALRVFAKYGFSPVSLLIDNG